MKYESSIKMFYNCIMSKINNIAIRLSGTLMSLIRLHTAT